MPFYNLLLHVSSGFQQQQVLKKPPTFLFIFHCIQVPLHPVLCVALVLALFSRGHERRSFLPYSRHPLLYLHLRYLPRTIPICRNKSSTTFSTSPKMGPSCREDDVCVGHVPCLKRNPRTSFDHSFHRRRSGQLTCREVMATCPLISSLQFFMHCVAEYSVFAYLTSTVLEFRLQS